MQRTSKGEIERETGEKRENLRDTQEVTEGEISTLGEAIRISDAQSEPILDETEHEIKSHIDSLGETGYREVEQKAEIVDEGIQVEHGWEKDLVEKGHYEQDAATLISAGLASIGNAAMAAELARMVESRKQGEEFLDNESEEVKADRLSNTEEIAKKRSNTRSMISSMKRL